MPTEAEFVSGHSHCVFRALVFAFWHVWFHVLPRDNVVVLHEDTQAMITVVRVRRDPTFEVRTCAGPAGTPWHMRAICLQVRPRSANKKDMEQTRCYNMAAGVLT